MVVADDTEIGMGVVSEIIMLLLLNGFSVLMTLKVACVVVVRLAVVGGAILVTGSSVDDILLLEEGFALSETVEEVLSVDLEVVVEIAVVRVARTSAISGGIVAVNVSSSKIVGITTVCFDGNASSETVVNGFITDKASLKTPSATLFVPHFVIRPTFVEYLLKTSNKSVVVTLSVPLEEKYNVTFKRTRATRV